MKESLSKFMAESTKRHDENSNLIKEMRASTDAAIRNQRASIKALDIQIGQTIMVLQERGSGSLPNSIEMNQRDHVKSILTIVKVDTSLICLLADLGASISVMPYSTFTNLGLGELAPTKLIIELVDRTRKRPKGIAENVLVGLRERMELDLEARLMGEDLILNISLRSNDEGRKIHIDCGYNLQFTCMIDAYRDEGMGDVIVGKPFCREIYVKVRRFDGMITIYNGNDGVTYQMLTHPDPVPLGQNVVPSAEKTDSSQQGLEFLFSPLLDEYYNPTHGLAEENNNDQAPNASFQEAEFINPLCTRVQEIGESSMPVRGNPSMPVQTRRQLATDPEM
ncbi:putative reverse transcriptase domain-containing protein, partial [Tanacetum coccineum]